MAMACAWDNQPTFFDECASLRVDAMWCKLLETLTIRPELKSLKRGDEGYIKCVFLCA